MIPAVGYVRVSQAREEMLSPDLQRAAITAWAKSNGRRITGWLEDLDLSGRGFARRKISDGITAVEHGTREILVYRYDRWGRNAADSLANIRRVELAGGAVVSVTEPFDPDSAIGRYSRTNALALAEMQSDIIGENWRATQAHRVGRGLPANGWPRYGYTITSRKRGGDGLHHPCPVTGPHLAAAYRDYAAGVSTYTIAQRLNAAGQRTTKGAPWSDATVRSVLDSGFAAGLLRVDVHTSPRWVPAAHDPLITVAEWDAYRARRAERAGLAPRLRTAVYPLSGLMLCANCGAGLRHQVDRRPGYATTVRCTRRYRTGDCRYPLMRRVGIVEADVRGWVRDLVAGRDAQWVAALQRRQRTPPADVDALERQAADVRRRLAKAADGWARDLIDDVTYTGMRAGMRAELADLEAGLAAAVAPQVEPMPVAELSAVLDAWDRIEPAALNTALRELIGAVVVDRQATLVVGRWELRP